MVAEVAAHHRLKGKCVCCRCSGQEGCRRGCTTIGGLAAHCVHCVKMNQSSSQDGTKDCGETCRICRESGMGEPEQASNMKSRSACEKDGGAARLVGSHQECYYELSQVRRCAVCLRTGHLTSSCPEAEESAPRRRPSWTPTLAAQPGVCCARCSTLGHTEAHCWVPCSCWGTKGHEDVFCARDTGAGR